MKRTIITLSVAAGLLLSINALGADDLKFTKERISDVIYEAASVADVNRDGKLDIISGEYWFPGPDFKQRHKMCELLQEREYFDDFGDYPMDVNGDGRVDIISGGWFGKKLTWREQPENPTQEWTVHLIEEVGSIERPCFYDLDGDGIAEVIPNLPGGALMVFKLDQDASGKGKGSFSRYDISSEKQGHGMGVGDINGDGRPDIILHAGWCEAPEKTPEGTWEWHPDFDVGHASVPIIVYDVNEDGKNDLIVGMGHDYGLAWWEQGDGAWTKHDIETDRSQFHELELADITNDGVPELITGKRYKAHNGKDPGSDEPVGLYYYTIKKGALKRHVIDYGAPGECSGAGIYLWIADMDGNGWQDIVAPGKEGLYLFKNQGPGK